MSRDWQGLSFSINLFNFTLAGIMRTSSSRLLHKFLQVFEQYAPITFIWQMCQLAGSYNIITYIRTLYRNKYSTDSMHPGLLYVILKDFYYTRIWELFKNCYFEDVRIIHDLITSETTNLAFANAHHTSQYTVHVGILHKPKLDFLYSENVSFGMI